MSRIEEDAEWVERILAARRSGDTAPFAELVDRFAPRVLSVLRGLLTGEADAEDVSQDVFVKVYRSLHRWNAKSSLFTWIYRIAINAAHDHNKKARRHRALSLDRQRGSDREDGSEGLDVPAPEREDSGAAFVLGQERVEAVHRALADLPEKFREILVLRELDGLAYEDISQTLGIKKGTVESRLFRARQMLRQVAERHHLERLL